MNRFSRTYLTVILMLAGTVVAGSGKPVPSQAEAIRQKEKPAPSQKETIESYETLVQRIMRENMIAGAGAALILDDRVVWKKGFGFSDRENKIPYTTRTAQPIGSVTKPITALGLMRLQEQGLLDIDRPLVEVLPAFRIHTRGVDIRRITVRSLITHTSGLPNDIFLNATRPDEKYTGLLSYLRDETLAFPPGTVYHYSNVGIGVLGHVILAVGKQDYPAYMQRHIFQAVGMSHTGFIEYDRLEDVGLSYDGEGKPVKTPRIRAIPAGGLYSSVDDMTALARELIAIYHGKKGGILKPETVREIFREQDDSAKISFHREGLAWSIFKNESGFIVFHFGSDNINWACFMIHPERKAALVVLSNSAGGKVLTDALSEQFRDALGFKELDWIVTHTENPRKNEIIPLTPEMIQAHSGTYGHVNRVFDAVAAGGKLMLKYGKTTLELKPVSPDEFIPYKLDDTGKAQSLDSFRVIFERVGDYQVLFWETEARQREALGYKLPPQTITDSWKRRLGKYQIQGYQNDGPETFSEAELSLFEDRLLQLKIFYTSGTYVYNLRIENDHELVTCGFDEVSSGDTLRFRQEGKDILITYYGLTLRKKT